MRRFGNSPRSDTRYTPRPGVYAILLRAGRVLLTHQQAPSPEFQLPGGGIDPGENPLHALHREVFEETGWCVGSVRRVDVHKRFTYMPEYDLWAEKICTIYLARPALRLGPPSEPGHTEFWVPARSAAGLVASPGDRAALRAVIG
ncbi:NUDIX domain-containing protein [Meridianimarinicoccus aquatilis]|uniref:NUDIX domain-containing protein n=1 Tax=Meridianimarinicoccus aquatilis TaxID=2552766 RepID=A0A4R6AYZ7_9RHOB|nr:NUDIX hydrolase [Fluviibacterium aquatile]TDL89102.1 NUDIX domain-containing protein [Fluviibacterium aquatile]